MTGTTCPNCGSRAVSRPKGMGALIAATMAMMGFGLFIGFIFPPAFLLVIAAPFIAMGMAANGDHREQTCATCGYKFK